MKGFDRISLLPGAGRRFPEFFARCNAAHSRKGEQWGKAFVTRSVMKTPLQAQPVARERGSKFTGSSEEVRGTGARTSRPMASKPPRGERPLAPQDATRHGSSGSSHAKQKKGRRPFSDEPSLCEGKNGVACNDHVIDDAHVHHGERGLQLRGELLVGP